MQQVFAMGSSLGDGRAAAGRRLTNIVVHTSYASILIAATNPTATVGRYKQVRKRTSKQLITLKFYKYYYHLK